MEVTGQTYVVVVVDFDGWSADAKLRLIDTIVNGEEWEFGGETDVTLDYEPEPQHNEGMD